MTVVETRIQPKETIRRKGETLIEGNNRTINIRSIPDFEVTVR